MKTIAIYKITSPSKKIYIGQSWDCKVRFSTYRRMYKKAIGRKLYNSFLKYGVESHTFEILKQFSNTTKEELDEYELFYIYRYKLGGFNLLNLTDGGGGSKGYKHTEDTKRKMSELKKNSGYLKGRNNPNYGKGLFGDKNGMFGKKRPPEMIDFMRKKASKPVIQYSLNGDEVGRFNSAKEAAKAVGTVISAVCAACHNPNKSAKGFRWKYELPLYHPIE